MASRKDEGQRAAKRSPLFKGYEKVTFMLTSELAAAIKGEALRRAAESGTRPDASELARQALGAWLAKHKR